MERELYKVVAGNGRALFDANCVLAAGWFSFPRHFPSLSHRMDLGLRKSGHFLNGRNIETVVQQAENNLPVPFRTLTLC